MRSEFNLFSYGTWPHYWYREPSSIVAAGGSAQSLGMFSQVVQANHTYGWLYKQKSFLNHVASVAVRVRNGMGTLCTSTGLFVRSPILFSDGAQLGLANQNWYTCGITLDETNAAVNVQLFRVLFGTTTAIGTSRLVPIVNNQYIQFALKVENDISDNVDFNIAWNTGTSLSIPTPGLGTWTAWDYIGNDAGHGDILNLSGYAGFGQHKYTSTASAGSTTALYFDQFRVEELL